MLVFFPFFSHRSCALTVATLASIQYGWSLVALNYSRIQIRSSIGDDYKRLVQRLGNGVATVSSHRNLLSLEFSHG